MVTELVEGPNKVDNFKLIKFTAQQSDIIAKSPCVSAALCENKNIKQTSLSAFAALRDKK